jgi:hypothetical protein
VLAKARAPPPPAAPGPVRSRACRDRCACRLTDHGKVPQDGLEGLKVGKEGVGSEAIGVRQNLAPRLRPYPSA